uniref:Transmembrane protein n=1 Tax=Rhizophora mucronata TaxID=61149 RepID=A0A2P2NZF9_RHIMU
MGLFSFTMAGGAFILIGASESLACSSSIEQPNSDQTSPLTQISKPTDETNPKPQKDSTFTSSFTYVAITVLSFLFIINSLISLFSAFDKKDRVGSAVQLQVIAVAFLFLLYSVLGLISNSSASVRFPLPLLNLILLFGFVEEFLLFYLQRKDKNGVENRYFDLMLVPISICMVSTVLELKSPLKVNEYARLARGVGLILQGTWFVQMGLSFYTYLMVHGCSLRERSRGNYTIRCKGHREDHRGKGIATIQFNCHLALLVVFLVALYAMMAKTNRDRVNFRQYKPLGAEMQQVETNGHFTLDSDEDDIREEENENSPKRAIEERVADGYGSYA